MTLGLLGAALTAVCYGSGSILQSVSARRTSASAGLDPRLLVRLARQGPYLAGTLLDALGFLASVLALRTLPLFLVESAVASSVGVTALLAWRLLEARLRAAEVRALAGLGVGLVLLAVAAEPGPAHEVGPTGRWLLLAGAGLVLVVGLVAAHLDGVVGAAAMAAGAGLGFGGVGVAARVLVVPHPWWHVLADPLLYALAGYGVLATLLFAMALQRGSVTTASAVTFAVETVVPAAIGLGLLGDATRPHLAVVAALGFVMTLGGAILLARRAEPPGPA